MHAVFLCKVINLKRLCSLSKEVSFNQFNPVALRKAKIVYNFGLSECSRVNGVHVAQSVGHLTCKLGVLGSIPSLATYFGFSFRFFKKDSCQLLHKVCARSTG